jgi:MFS family permease
MKADGMSRRALAITGIVYLLTVLSMATVGLIVPSMDNLAVRLSASKAEIGFAIALFSIPSAALATIGGGVIDQIGAKRAMLISAAIAVAGDILAYAAPSLLLFDLGMILAGIGFAGISVAAPALLMDALDGGERIRAMSLWSTYAPTGFAVGLLLAAPLVDGPHWRVALLLHAALMLAGLTAVALVLPAPTGGQAARSAGRHLADTLAIFRDGPVLRLAIAVTLPNAVSYGTSLIAPSYLAKTYHISLAASSGTVAFAKIFAMIVGGVVMGALLARRVSSLLLFGVTAAIGVAAQIMLYLPGSGLLPATCALIVWLFAFGGMSGTAMAMLPQVVRDPARKGTASGLVGQFISLGSFAAPSIYFAMEGWIGFVLIAAAALGLAAVMLPARRETRATA